MNHKKLILTGFVIFGLGFAMGVRLMPLSIVSLILGTLISSYGAIIWLCSKENRLKYKEAMYPKSSFPEMVKQAFDFRWSRISILWTTVAFIFMLLIHIGSLGMKSTSAYGSAVEAIKRDEAVLKRIGEVQAFTYLVSGNVAPRGYSRLHFGVVGSKESVWIEVVVEAYNGNYVTRSIVINP